MNKNLYSWIEVSKHNKPNDLWLIIDRKVYDITKWISKHPGGKDTLILCGGRECTNVFESYHPFSDKPNEILEKYFIGYITNSSEHPNFIKKSKFYSELKERVRKHFKETKKNSKLSLKMIRCFFVLISILLSYYFTYFYSFNSFFINCYFSFLFGFCNTLYILHIMHDASHFSISNSPFIWKLFGAGFDFISGQSFYVWLHQHTIGHHIYTNIRNADPDTGEGDHDIRIITPFQTHFWFHKYQHIYSILLYSIFRIRNFLMDFEFFTKNSLGPIRYSYPRIYDYLIFIFGKLFFILTRFFLPLKYFNHSISNIIIYYLIAEITIGLYSSLVFQVNHVADDLNINLTLEKPNEPLNINEDWAIYEIGTAQDYSYNSKFWIFFSGCLNYQIVHHLFPSISQDYYPEIAPIIIDLCKEYNIKYNYHKTYYDALKSHFNYLYKMGNDQNYVKKK